MFLFCCKNTNFRLFIFKGYKIKNILQLLPGLEFDICYVIKERVRFGIAEMTNFLNYIGSYSFTLKTFNLEILENSLEYVYSEVIFIYLLNAKLLMSNFSAEILIFKYF